MYRNGTATHACLTWYMLWLHIQWCQNYTSTAHSPQRTVKTLTKVEAKVEDGDYERRREDGDLPFPKLKSLYYWSLIILICLTEYLSNNKQGKIGIAHDPHFLVLCYMPYYRYISLSRKYT